LDEIAILCNDVSLAVADSIKDLVGTKKGGGWENKQVDLT